MEKVWGKRTQPANKICIAYLAASFIYGCFLPAFPYGEKLRLL